MTNPLANLIAQGEGLHLDFKFEISDSRKIARSLVAFANTSGGRLLVGVKDNGRIAGVRSDEEFYMVDAAAGMFCRPEVLFDVREWDIEGKKVLEINVAESDTKPHLAPDKEGIYRAYVRSADQNVLADEVQQQVWALERDPKGVTIVYRDAESALMEILREKTSTTHLAFARLSGISEELAAVVLAKFFVLGIVQMDIFEEVSVFYLKDHSLNGKQ